VLSVNHRSPLCGCTTAKASKLTDLKLFKPFHI
jgi:hypothetical protein